MERKEMVERLSQLKDMKCEVDELSQRIGRMEQKTRGRAVAPGLERARTLMEARRWACMEELGKLYAFIDDIPDSRLRRIFSFRYIDGLSWLQVAFKIGEHDEQYPRRLHNRYLTLGGTLGGNPLFRKKEGFPPGPLS